MHSEDSRQRRRVGWNGKNHSNRPARLRALCRAIASQLKYSGCAETKPGSSVPVAVKILEVELLLRGSKSRFCHSKDRSQSLRPRNSCRFWTCSSCSFLAAFGLVFNRDGLTVTVDSRSRCPTRRWNRRPGYPFWAALNRSCVPARCERVPGELADWPEAQICRRLSCWCGAG